MAWVMKYMGEGNSELVWQDDPSDPAPFYVQSAPRTHYNEGTDMGLLPTTYTDPRSGGGGHYQAPIVGWHDGTGENPVSTPIYSNPVPTLSGQQQIVQEQDFYNFNSPFWQTQHDPSKTHWLQAYKDILEYGGGRPYLLTQASKAGYFNKFPSFNDPNDWARLQSQFGVDQNQGGLWGSSPADFIGKNIAEMNAQDDAHTNSQWTSLATIAASALGAYLLQGGASGAGTVGAEGTAGPYGGFDNAAVAGADYGFGSAAAGGTAGAFSPSEIGFEAASPSLSPSEIGLETVGGVAGANQAVGSAAGNASAGGSSAATGGGAAAGGSALSRLLGGAATATDLLDLAGRLAPSLLGAYASNRQANSLEDLANKYFDVGAPSRARFEASFAPGFSMDMDPGYKDMLDQTTKSFLHKASVTGNPADSPNAWMQTLKDVNSTFAYPALNEYRRMNAGAGGLASLTAAAPGLDRGAVDAQRGVYDSIGVGAADIFNPPKSLGDILRDYRRYS